MKAIDLFAGAGGFSEGARQAGVHVVWAANHCPIAVATHLFNHPEAEHACQDLRQADFTRVPAYDILLASPACQGHSRARGVERPHHDALRATAWAVVDAAEATRPRALIVENVPEFQEWALFRQWTGSLEALGYQLTISVQNAADWGVPQARRRVFVVGTLSAAAVTIQAPGEEHVPARAIIDWSALGWGSIADRARPLASRTLACIADGRRRYGERFLVPYYGSETRARSADKPVGTMRTSDAFAVVDGDRFRMFGVSEVRRAMTFPDHYHLPPRHKDAMRLLGNAVPPLMARGVIAQVADQIA